MKVEEHYNARPMAANSVLNVGGSIAGFLPTVSGTLTATDADSTVLVNLVPVTAGIYCKIPLYFRSSTGNTVTLAGGAAGTLFS